MFTLVLQLHCRSDVAGNALPTERERHPAGFQRIFPLFIPVFLRRGSKPTGAGLVTAVGDHTDFHLWPLKSERES